MRETQNKTYGFLAYDFIGVEKELNEMAVTGWQLESIGAHFWTYRKTEPNQFKYCVTYVPDASIHNPEPTPHQSSLEDLCESAGWQKVANWNQMQIFASKNPDAPPIDTDANVLLDITTRSICKRNIPIYVALLLFFAIILTFKLMNIPSANAEAIVRADFFTELIPDIICIFFALSYIFNFLLWRRRSKKSIEVNDTCADCNLHYVIQAVESIILIAFSVLFVILKCNIKGWGTLEMTFYPFVAGFFFLFMFYLSKFFRFIGASKIVNMILTFIGSAFLSLFLSSICSAIFMALGILITS